MSGRGLPNVAASAAARLTYFVLNQPWRRLLTSFLCAVFERYGGDLIDSHAVIDALRSATRRTILFLLVAVSLAVNVTAGAFAGYAHAHDHEHGEKHSHQHRAVTADQHDHDHDDDDAPNEATGSAGLPRSDGGQHDTLHEHGAIVVLALGQDGNLAPLDGGSSPGMSDCRSLLFDLKHPLERPPR